MDQLNRAATAPPATWPARARPPRSVRNAVRLMPAAADEAGARSAMWGGVGRKP
jgi:hypothetical protein